MPVSGNYSHPYCASEDQDQVIMSSRDSQSPPTWPPMNHVWPPTKLIQVHSLTYNILNMMLNTMYCCMYVCTVVYEYPLEYHKKSFTNEGSCKLPKRLNYCFSVLASATNRSMFSYLFEAIRYLPTTHIRPFRCLFDPHTPAQLIHPS